MNINEISKPVTAAFLNESLAKRFGQRINLEAFTLEQLQDARNKVRTKLSQVETNESFDGVYKNEGYQKSKLFLDVLNAEISERESVAEAKPDFLDLDKDGNKKEPMKKAAKDAKKDDNDKGGKKGMTDKQKKYFGKKNESIVREGAEDAAELVMAAKDMVDRVTGWMEDTAEMQTESMLELADAIRDEMGSEQSEAFTNAIKPALEQMYTTMETTRQSLIQGVGMLTGEAEPADTMGADDTMDAEEPEMEPTVDAEEPAEDDFGAADAATGGEEEAGREKRESIERSRKLGTILSKKK